MEETNMITLKNILVATDFGEAADVALTYGRTLASRFGATLHVMYVAQAVPASALGAESYALSIPELERQIEEAARKQLAERLMDSDNSGPHTISVVIAGTSPALAIVDYARNHDVDLIVMGTHGRGALAHLFMGSVAERVVRLAGCPVLTVRHPEHEFVRPDALAAVASA
jgi:nucleotide-binding universal stress UspA family protein